jgi:ubiquinone/menaquinone biosynthesis C-methylase UbiE
VYAVDLWEEGITSLQEEVSARKIENLKGMVADVGESIPLDDNSIDLCFIATAFHDFVLAGIAETALNEVARVLKGDGYLAILEFKKIEGPPGPPLSSRLAPDEVERKIVPYGFKKERFAEIAPYTYLIIFCNSAALFKV